MKVGYGDFFPMTHMGRSVGVLACLLGTFLVSFMIIALTSTSEFSQLQEKVNLFTVLMSQQ